MALLGYLYNIDSDRQICEEVGYNLAYRWFCKLSLKDSVPDHSSMTRIRDRFGEETFERIFTQILDQCRKSGLVTLKQMMVDGSVIQANASVHKMKVREVTNGARRAALSSKSRFSPVDPEATLARKSGQSKILGYKTHSAIDADSRVIVDCFVTTAAVAEVSVFKERVEKIETETGLKIGEMIADRGYGSSEALKFLSDSDIESNIPLWNSRSGETFLKQLESGFIIDPGSNKVTCPEGHEMRFSSHDKPSGRDLYVLPRTTCHACPRAKSCLTKYEFKNRGKKFGVINEYKTILETTLKSNTETFKIKLVERMWKMEGIFAEAKAHHGMRRARYRGRAKVQIQVYMTSTLQNLKRLASVALKGTIGGKIELTKPFQSAFLFCSRFSSKFRLVEFELNGLFQQAL